jgi:hypothetical protein
VRRVTFSCFARPDTFSAVPRASQPVFLHALTRFLRNRGRPLPFSCFDIPNSFSSVRRVLGPIFMFYASGLFFGGTERIGSYFNVLRSRARFRRYGERRVSISCFAVPDSFSAVPRSSVPVLLALTNFRRYRGCRDPFSYFALPDSFSAVPRASGPVFMFRAPELVFDSTEGAPGHILVFMYSAH